jgi:enoyl-CoA hydratase/carnithine racemase
LSSDAIPVTATVRDDVLQIDLANPDRRNAIDEVFTGDLIRALEAIERVRAVLLGSRRSGHLPGRDFHPLAQSNSQDATLKAAQKLKTILNP